MLGNQYQFLLMKKLAKALVISKKILIIIGCISPASKSSQQASRLTCVLIALKNSCFGFYELTAAVLKVGVHVFNCVFCS